MGVKKYYQNKMKKYYQNFYFDRHIKKLYYKFKTLVHSHCPDFIMWTRGDLWVVLGDVIEINSLTAVAILDSKEAAQIALSTIKKVDYESKYIGSLGFCRVRSTSIFLQHVKSDEWDTRQSSNSLYFGFGYREETKSIGALFISDSEERAQNIIEMIKEEKDLKHGIICPVYTEVKPESIYIHTNIDDYNGEKEDQPFIKRRRRRTDINIASIDDKIPYPTQTHTTLLRDLYK